MNTSVYPSIHLDLYGGCLDEAETGLKGIDSPATFGRDGAMNIAPPPLTDWLGWRPNLLLPVSSSSSSAHVLETNCEIVLCTAQQILRFILACVNLTINHAFHPFLKSPSSSSEQCSSSSHKRVVSLNLAMCWGQYIPGVILLWQETDKMGNTVTYGNIVFLTQWSRMKI